MPRIRIPYRTVALDKGYCSLDEARAYDRWVAAVQRMAAEAWLDHWTPIERILILVEAAKRREWAHAS